ncbi:TldD/PmbA family protein [bacterium]|nr:TldD/PmbA family protein [bacterium]
MKEFTDFALNSISVAGVSYGDIRIVSRRSKQIFIKNGNIERNNYSFTIGFGIRVLYKGSWGFASGYDLTKINIEKACKKAILIAENNSMISNKKVILAPNPVFNDTFYSTYEKNPFDMDEGAILSHLLKANNAMKLDKKIIIATTNADFRNEEKYFANTDGSFIYQNFIQTGGGIGCFAFDGNEIAKRSYPASFGGDYRNSGWEFILSMDLENNGRRIAKEAIELLNAPSVPYGRKDIVLEGSQLALQIHESIGHPTELDRVLGYERSFAGTSFATPDKLYDLQYGSPLVNIVADATNVEALGGFAYDDEGVQAQSTYLIKDGLFVGYQTSRETASVIGQVSNGTMRADGFQNIPLVRMTSINLLPGKSSFEDIIGEIEHGFYFLTNKSWSIDDKRLNFQFGCEIAYEIKKGKLGKIYKNPTYTGITPKFWNSCDAIGSKEHYRIWGIPNCGKGEPSQTARVSHGASFARFRNIEIGVGNE